MRSRRIWVRVVLVSCALAGAGVAVSGAAGSSRTQTDPLRPPSPGAPSPGLLPCSASQLKLSAGAGVSERTQQITRVQVLRNSSGSSCALRGRPKLTLFDRAGHPLRFIEHDRGDRMLTHAPAVSVILRPGARAYFAINQNECAERDQAVVTRVLVAVSGASRPLSLRLPGGPVLALCAAADPAGRALDISPYETRLDQVLSR